MNILYVEDEKYLARAVAQVLRKENYQVDLAHDGQAGLDLALAGLYDIIILDIMLPILDGISVLKRLREAGVSSPIILLTARGEIDERIAGLDDGADDYLTKPFHSAELLAHIRALARRRGQLFTDDTITFGDIELNYTGLELRGSDHSFHLTLKETQLLELLMINQGQTIPTARIIEKLWGWDSPVEDSNVQVQVAFVRKKLALLSQQVRIRTIRGVGYVLELNQES
ncbi:MAG: response regulator transcription factor [Coriobacteriales bacterium]|nr:response regulator transcription factor [Coriobacteriales bacterium]